MRGASLGAETASDFVQLWQLWRIRMQDFLVETRLVWTAAKEAEL